MTDCPKCESNKNRAARWRAEAYKQGGYDVIELPWVGLTDAEVEDFVSALWPVGAGAGKLLRDIEAKLKEKNT